MRFTFWLENSTKLKQSFSYDGKYDVETRNNADEKGVDVFVKKQNKPASDYNDLIAIGVTIRATLRQLLLLQTALFSQSTANISHCVCRSSHPTSRL